MIFPFDRVHEGTRHRVKDREKAEIFQAISRARTITRKEISTTVGARPTTVSNIVRQLVDDGLVSEGDVKEPGKQGRPEVFLHPRFDRLVALGLYVVSREIKGALVGLDGELLATENGPLPGDAGNELVIDTIVDVAKRLAAAKPANSELLGVGLSLPGSIDATERKWKYTARWRNIANLELDEVEKRLRLPVTPNRIINSRLEYLLLARPELRVGGTVLFHWGYGIGAAYARDGRVVLSSDGSFAEVGHWRVVHDTSKLCHCGGSGCLESVASLWALSPELESRYGTIPEDEVAFASLFQKQGMERDSQVVSARRQIASCVANLFLTLYPDRTLVYGPFTASRGAFEMTVDEVLRSVPPFVRKQVSLEALPLEYEGEVIGSTHRLFRKALRTLLIVRDSGNSPKKGDESGNQAVIDFPTGSY